MFPVCLVKKTGNIMASVDKLLF